MQIDVSLVDLAGVAEADALADGLAVWKHRKRTHAHEEDDCPRWCESATFVIGKHVSSAPIFKILKFHDQELLSDDVANSVPVFSQKQIIQFIFNYMQNLCFLREGGGDGLGKPRETRIRK